MMYDCAETCRFVGGLAAYSRAGVLTVPYCAGLHLPCRFHRSHWNCRAVVWASHRDIPLLIMEYLDSATSDNSTTKSWAPYTSRLLCCRDFQNSCLAQALFDLRKHVDAGPRCY